MDVARNLDFAAHWTLIESEYYQKDLILRRAEALALQLSTVVAPLFGLQQALDLWDVDILKEWERQRPTLIKMFVSALKIKARALVSKDMFEVIFPAQGSGFHLSLMEPEETERSRGSSTPEESSFVKLCLAPGLQKYPFDRKRVDYNSFRRPGGSVDESAVKIVEGVVIIDEP